MRRGVHAGPQPPPRTPLPARALAQQLLLLPSSRCHPAGAGAGDPAAGPALVAAVAAAVWSAGTRVQSQAGGGGPGRLQSACLSLAPGWPCRSPQPGGSRCQGGHPRASPRASQGHIICCMQDVAASLKDGAALTPVYPLPTVGTPLPPPQFKSNRWAGGYHLGFAVGHPHSSDCPPLPPGAALIAVGLTAVTAQH